MVPPGGKTDHDARFVGGICRHQNVCRIALFGVSFGTAVCRDHHRRQFEADAANAGAATERPKGRVYGRRRRTLAWLRNGWGSQSADGIQIADRLENLILSFPLLRASAPRLGTAP